MNRIRVIARENHQIADDTNESVAILVKAGIGAHEGKEEQAFGVIWIHEDADCDRALTMLRARALLVVDDFKGHADYEKSK
jgi:hypothetical protein